MLQTPNRLLKFCPLIFFVMAILQACDHDKGDGYTAGFAATPQAFDISNTSITEASGIADSKANAGYLWVQQDSGNPPGLDLLQHNGTWLKTIHLANVVNRDWEDIVLSTGPKTGGNYLYIAETGDNLLVHPDYAIYRLEE